MRVKKAKARNVSALVVTLVQILGSSCANLYRTEEDIKKLYNILPPVNEGYINTSGGRIYQVSAGNPNGRPVLFLHGSPGLWTNFYDVIVSPDFPGNVQAILPDRPGFGKTRGDAIADLRLEASMLVELLTVNTSGKKAIVVGHSYGGPLAARLIMDYPDKFAGMILLASSIDPDLEFLYWYNHFVEWPFVKWMIPDPLLQSNREILPLKNELQKMLPLWSGIDAKCLVIHGTSDRLVDISNVDFAEKMIYKDLLREIILEGEDHFLPWRHPDLIADSISEMTEELDSH